ncbi:hypothetical protein MP228_013101 [Amoeboaphelidium protococcarum]|nr:hypothetical protein MP228_013101 [Amoeboaphelidium protococcarum]
MITAVLLCLVGLVSAGDVVPRFAGITSCTSTSVNYASQKIYAACNHGYQYAPAIMQIIGDQMSVAKHTDFYHRLSCVASVSGDQVLYGASYVNGRVVLLSQANMQSNDVQQKQTGLQLQWPVDEMGCVTAGNINDGAYFFGKQMLSFTYGINSPPNQQVSMSTNVGDWQSVLSAVVLNNTLYVVGVRQSVSVIASFVGEQLTMIKIVQLSNATTLRSLVVAEGQIYAAGSIQFSSNETGLSSTSDRNAFYGQLNTDSLAIVNSKLVGNQTANEVITTSFYDKISKQLYLVGQSSQSTNSNARNLMYVRVGLESEGSEYKSFRTYDDLSIEPRSISSFNGTVVIVGEYTAVREGFIAIINNGSITNSAAEYNGGGVVDPDYGKKTPLFGDGTILALLIALGAGIPVLLIICAIVFFMKNRTRSKISANAAAAGPLYSNTTGNAYVEMKSYEKL